MGLLRIPLDIGSVMSASVALGIAVDDTVHLLSRFGSRRARGLGQIRASFGALAQCGWAMFQTTLVCGASLMAYWFSDFVPTSRFSLFMFALLSSAVGSDLFATDADGQPAGSLVWRTPSALVPRRRSLPMNWMSKYQATFGDCLRDGKGRCLPPGGRVEDPKRDSTLQ